MEKQVPNIIATIYTTHKCCATRGATIWAYHLISDVLLHICERSYPEWATLKTDNSQPDPEWLDCCHLQLWGSNSLSSAQPFLNCHSFCRLHSEGYPRPHLESVVLWSDDWARCMWCTSWNPKFPSKPSRCGKSDGCGEQQWLMHWQPWCQVHATHHSSQSSFYEPWW